jgi:hypothetical protein
MAYDVLAMRPLHERLVEEAKKRDPKFVPRPFTEKALALVPGPEDYRAFLLEVGKLTIDELTIGHTADFDASELPEDFRPFAEDEDFVYAFAAAVDREQALADFEAKKSELESDIEDDEELGELDEEEVEERREDLVKMEGEVARLDDEGEIGVATFDKQEREITRSRASFTKWLENMMIERAVRVALEPKKKAAATNVPDDRIARALDLLDLLVASKKLEVDDSFDENACAKKLAKCLDDPEAIAEVLVDARGVVELYATEHEIETALSD